VLEEAIEAKDEMAELAMEQTVEAADLPPGDVWISEESHTTSGSRNDADSLLNFGTHGWVMSVLPHFMPLLKQPQAYQPIFGRLTN
jgi:hypothetical protein